MNDKLTAEQILAEKGKLVDTTFGLSMYPLLKDRRDTVVIKRCNGRLKRYDVPLYRRGDQLVLHRVVNVFDNYYIICGDNCIGLEKVYDSQIIGVLSAFYRKDKFYTVDSTAYKIYSRLCIALYYPRLVYKRSRELLSKIKHKIKGD